MFRFSRLSCLLLALFLAIPLAAQAETTLERIARTGVLHVGTRDDAPPFAFRDGTGQLVGFSVDIIEAIRQALARALTRDIRTDFMTVTSMTRLTAIETHQADVVCETATMTWPRQQRVDFSLPIFRDGTRVLAYRDKVDSKRELRDMRIGIVDGAVTGEVLRARLPDVALQPFASMPAALRALEAGEVDGIANAGIVLRGLFPGATKRQGLVIVPRGEALGYETLACLLPKDDSRWRDFVNGVLRDLFRGIGEYRGGYVAIYDRWFGRDAEIAYPLDERTVQFFLATLAWLD